MDEREGRDESKEQHLAAALGYDIEKDKAPRVLARGRGEIAEKILEKADELNIPVRNDRDIVRVLVEMDPGEEIPPHLYEAAAEILSFIYLLEDEGD